jgi:large subunit ribosomal protein L12
MEYVYAALILHKLKMEINEANISNIIKATGATVNDAQVKALVSALADVNIAEAEAKKEEAPGKSEEQAMEGLASLFG